MKLEVTRDVVTDLWPLYRAGEASADSCALVDAFLAEDRAFATTLKESEMLPNVTPPVQLAPDAERRLLDDAREHARLKLLVIGGSIVLAAFLVLMLIGGAMFLVFRGH